VDLTATRVGPLDIEKARLEGRVERGSGEIKTLDVTGPDLRLTASGPIALTDAGQSNLTYHFDTPTLEKIGQLVGQPLGGGVTLDGRLTGNRADLRTTGTLDGSNVRYGENGALDLNSQYDVTLPGLSAERATIQATTTATFVKIGGAGGLELREIAAKTTYVGQKLDFDAKVNDRGRELQATGALIVHTDHNELHLPSLALRTEGIEWSLAGANATVQFDPREIRLKDVHLVSGDQSLQVDGSIARGGVGDVQLKPDATSADLTVKASNVDLAQLERLTLQERGLAGQLSADARLRGSLDAPRVEGTVGIVNGKFRTFSFESLRAKVDYAGSGVQLDARLQQNATQWLTAKGYAPLTLFRAEPGARAEHVPAAEADRVDLRIESSPIDLGVIQGFTTQVTDVKGTLRANVRVTGSGRDPHLEGAVEIHGGAFKVPLGGIVYTGLDTTLNFREDRVEVSAFELRDDHGNPLLVSGEIAVHERQVGAVNIQLQSDNFEVIDNELGEIEVDSMLKVTGELRRPRVEGRAKLEAGRVEVDRMLVEFAADPYATEATKAPDIEPGVQVAASGGGAHRATEQSLDAAAAGSVAAAPIEPVAPLPEAPQPGIYDQLALDVQVEIPDNLLLRGADLRPAGQKGLALGNMNMTIGGDLRVRKTAGDRPRLTGVVNTVRGFYEFQGRRFDVTRDGRIRFTGDADFNPLLDVTATREIDGVVARVHVRGTARAPELALSSTPPLDEADILSLIVFNTSINGLGTGERISLAQRAGAIASGFVAAPLAESIGKAFDLDLFEIETTSETGDFGANVTLGQQVSEQLFVKFRQQFGPQDASEFIMEYQLAKFLRFQGSAAPGGGQKANRLIRRRVERGAADLIFFFSY
jgi:autotransporter translocation and assembly factor TamB